MKQKHYESVVIINAILEDDKVEGVVKKIQETLTNGGAEIVDVDKWGRKRLAYPIKKQKTGYYVVLRFKADPSFIAKLDRFYRLEEEIYRSLTVILDKEALAYIEKKKSEAEKETAEEVTVQNEEKPVAEPKAAEAVEETAEEVFETDVDATEEVEEKTEE
jgi:small subunit ribosomal protein S6